MAENGSKKTQIKIGKEKLFALIPAVITFFMLFTIWFKTKEVFGISLTYSIFKDGVGDINGWMGVAKVFAIITLVVGILYVAAIIINFPKLIPGLKKFKYGFNRLCGLVYYGLFTLAILLNIIGCIASDEIVPSVRIIFVFVAMVCIVVLFAVPAISRGLSKKFEIVVE